MNTIVSAIRTLLGRFKRAPISSAPEAPIFALIIGTVCAGKTTYRKQHIDQSFVVLDAGEIFLSLNNGSWSKFGKILEEEVQEIGAQTALNALLERRNLVTEVLLSHPKQIEFILSTFKRLGYRTEVFDIDCELETSLMRNENREKNNISAYFTESYHINWLMDALKIVAQNGEATMDCETLGRSPT